MFKIELKERSWNKVLPDCHLQGWHPVVQY